MAKETRKYITKREKAEDGKYYLVFKDKKTGQELAREPWTTNKAKLSNIHNRLEHHNVEEYWKNKLKQRTPDQKAFQELKTIQQTLDQYPNIKDVGTSMKREGHKTFKPKIRSQGKIDNNKLIKTYQQILKGKVTNEKEIKEIIKHREKKLKNRLALKITITTTNGQTAIIDVGGILLEKENDTYDYWTNRYIDSNSIDAHAEEYRTIIGNPKIFKLHKTGIVAGRVKNVTTEWTIA